MSFYQNPFPQADADRHEIWQMLVERDIIAFCQESWEMVADDFVSENFMGIDGRRRPNPDSWQLSFPSLGAYKKEWLFQAHDFAKTEWAEDPEQAIYEATTLRDIEIEGDSALAHKKFDGHILKKNGEKATLNWQTLYRCRKVAGRWKIAGFTGYLPHPMGQSGDTQLPGKQLPAGAKQHDTAGPYSPVLQVTPGQIVVISGQAAIDSEGKVVGDTIEEQTHYTIKNCLQQLQTGGCGLNDVFKVNVYLTDLDNWPRFNEVYKTYFKAPRPVRTAVQTPLLYTFLVEIEMWAIKK
ncbi:RidA family protein [Fulvivirgaceae bacterium BMA12]|uniref:RidA family protein n=1 Tax=Agaribacillus aureus TaxID=3051825 RepID=A0ABT8L9R2_9BACT|nr:RidA family protein [Fulvivirgaceae bacterium BMA12]